LVHPIGLVFGLYEEVSFSGINNELSRYAERFQSVPEFVGLDRGTFGIALTDYDQGGGLHILDEMNWRTFLINGGVVVNGCAEEGNHPLVNQVLAVVTLPIGYARSRHGAAETVRLRYGPHGHEPAVTPASHAQTRRIDRMFP